MTGSEAKGCMVVLLGESENTTVTLMRNISDTEKMIVHRLAYPLSCYDRVLAYDIESDGSTGTLAVPVMMHVLNHLPAEQCSPPEETSLQGE